ncbi:MAG: PEP-CTERM sorting domain-containing protein [Candidatus Obscuribacterales bacterium]|nr:PEP-CTERM sorting domain-containing protein [Candidatus Obscuribacterales bacterium]
MNNLFKAVLALISLVASLISTSASASVITFDDAYSSSIVGQQTAQSIAVGGLTFTGFGTFPPGVWSGSPNSNGTNDLIFAGSSTDYLAITKTGGGTFDLNSIDLTISWYDNNATEMVDVNGSPISISQGMQTFSLYLTGVTQVNISGVSSGTGYWALDNVNFSDGSTVPEPGSMALVGLGLVAFVTTRRRQFR